MPVLTIKDEGTFNVTAGQRLVLAIEACGVDIGHRCGGNARCTTCRVEFLAGEPDTMTRAEHDKLQDRGLLGEVRLSCQIVVDQDMSVAPLIRVHEKGWTDPGPAPDPTVMPSPERYSRAELDATAA